MTKLINVFVSAMVEGLFSATSFPMKELKDCVRFLPPIGVSGISQDFKVLEENVVTSIRVVQNGYTNKKSSPKRQTAGTA